MYARIENNTIKVYTVIPSKFRGTTGNYAGGFHKLSNDIHLIEGFKPLVEPSVDRPKINKLGDLVELGLSFTYTIIPIYPGITLGEAKLKRMLELKDTVDPLFQENQWYYDREYKTDKIKDKETKVVPDEILLATGLLYNEYDRIEIEINALDNPEDVLEYVININL